MLRWMALAIVPTALLTLQAQALQGLRRIADASLVGNVAVPLFLLGGSAVLAPRWGALGATLAYVLAALLTMLLGIWRWRQATPQLHAVSGRFDTSTLLESSVPLFWVSCFQQIITWAPTVILGVMASSADVGIFGAANRAAMLTSFVLLAVNSISAPKFAALHRTGDLATLGSVARRSAKLMAVLASPILHRFRRVSDPRHDDVRAGVRRGRPRADHPGRRSVRQRRHRLGGLAAHHVRIRASDAGQHRRVRAGSGWS